MKMCGSIQSKTAFFNARLDGLMKPRIFLREIFKNQTYVKGRFCMKKRILSIMLMFCMLAAFMPCIAGAEEPVIVESGTCGATDSDNVTWDS